MPHALYPFFHPQAVAVVGASDRYGSSGRRVFGRLSADPAVPLAVPVNTRHKTVGGQTAYENLAAACKDHPIDTAVVILSADKISGIIAEAAKAGIRQMVVVNDWEQPVPSATAKLKRAADAAVKSGIRMLAVPTAGIEGLYRCNPIRSCTYIGQSVGIADCIRNYAAERGIVFKRFITTNPIHSPLSTGRIIDFAAAEEGTEALLVHVSRLDRGQELISALAAAARSKPVVVLPTLIDPAEEALFDRILARNHIFKVGRLGSFLTSAKLMHTGLTSQGGRVGLVGNTAHIGTLAMKNLAASPLQTAAYSQHTVRSLGKILPYKPAAANPLYLPADTPPAVFQAARDSCLHDEHTDPVIALYTGQNPAESLRTAQMAAGLQERHRSKPLFLVWLGSADTAEVRSCFSQTRNLYFRQPEQAVLAMQQLEYYRHHRQERHRSGMFYDYRRAAAAAESLRKILRPLLPVVAHPATRTHTAGLLSALGFTKGSLKTESREPDIILQWGRQAPFGQILTLNDTPLLPPVLPEEIAQVLETAGLSAETWQNALLDTAEIFSRLPEIHSARLALFANSQSKIVCQDIKLSLQDPDSSVMPNFTAPYPAECEQTLRLPDGQTAYLRPVRTEDAEPIRRLIEAQSPESRRLRFMGAAEGGVPPSVVSRLTRFDYSREFALLLQDESGAPLATAAYNADPDGQSCEFGISVADRLHGQGIGSLLMEKLAAHARKQGYTLMRAEILSENIPMQKLALKLGFTLSKHPQDRQLVNAQLVL